MKPDMDAAFVLTRVGDGDTVNGILNVELSRFDGWVLTGSKADRFRLINLDTPERGEVGWAEARSDVVDWFRAHPSTRARTYGRDAFGRILADIYDASTGDTLTQFMLKHLGWEPWVPR